MDPGSALSQQWKERESKLFSQKAETHAKEMKTLTGTPKIDPLSKKIADILTKRELESLGIRQTEPIVKKPTHVLPTPQKNSVSSKPLVLKAETAEPKAHSRKATPEMTIPQISVIPTEEEKKKSQENPLVNEEIYVATPGLSPNPGEKEDAEEGKPPKAEKVVTEDNVENIDKFKEELQREYPELGLNNSIEGSSFHTNELNELEEACKELSSEIHDTKNSQVIITEELMQDLAVNEKNQDYLDLEKKKNIEEISNKSECGDSQGKKKFEENYEENYLKSTEKEQITTEELLNFKVKSERKKILKNESSPSLLVPDPAGGFSKYYSLQEAQTKDLSGIQQSFVKARFLHSPQEAIPRTIPRCHINLMHCKSSPIYFSVRAPLDSRIKCENGVGLVHSLRRLLLKNLVEEDEKSENFYEKNLNWLKVRDEKLEEIRKSLKNKDLENCTFDPYFEKHESQKRLEKSGIFEYQAVNIEAKPKSPRSFTPKISENIQKYSSLSPADNLIRYDIGFPIEKFLKKAKPMVPYHRINFLT